MAYWCMLGKVDSSHFLKPRTAQPASLPRDARSDVEEFF